MGRNKKAQKYLDEEKLKRVNEKKEEQQKEKKNSSKFSDNSGYA